MTVQFQGQERTPAQMAPFLEEGDRTLRRTAWEIVADRRLADKDGTGDDLFDKMIALRVAIATEAGFSSYLDYAFRSRERFDYGVEETIRLHDAIEQIVVPLCREIQEERAGRWSRDAPAVGPCGRSLGRPRSAPSPMSPRSQRGPKQSFATSMPSSGGNLPISVRAACSTWPTARGRLPAAIRPRSRTNGCRSSSRERRRSRRRRADPAFPRRGHAFHALGQSGELPAAYRESPIEFCEVASMTASCSPRRPRALLWGPDDANRSYRQLLLRSSRSSPGLQRSTRFSTGSTSTPVTPATTAVAAWMGVARSVRGIVDWSGYDDARAHGWHRQKDIFSIRSTTSSTGSRQLGAFQIWYCCSLTDAAAVAAYRRSARRRGRTPLAQLLPGRRHSSNSATSILQPLIDAIGKSSPRSPRREQHFKQFEDQFDSVIDEPHGMPSGRSQLGIEADSQAEDGRDDLGGTHGAFSGRSRSSRRARPRGCRRSGRRRGPSSSQGDGRGPPTD